MPLALKASRLSDVLLCLTMCAFTLITACRHCEYAVEREARSPDGLLIATAYIRYCGSIGGSTTVIQLRRTQDAFHPESSSGVVVQMVEWADLGADWSDNGSLTVTCGPCNPGRVLSVTHRWNGVAVRLLISGQPFASRGIVADH
jgi:hypothetical protein